MKFSKKFLLFFCFSILATTPVLAGGNGSKRMPPAVAPTGFVQQMIELILGPVEEEKKD